jgi:beta-glucanase (GH16 family)
MRKLNYILLLIVLFVNIKNSKAQIPINDPGWNIQNSLSDEFNGSSLNTSKWNKDWINDWDHHSLAAMYDSNIVVSGGSLKLYVDTLIPGKYYPNTLGIDSFRYQGASISSIVWSYKYGYFEMNAKLPVGYDAYWPAFWLWGTDGCSTGSQWYQEIDIAENGPAEAASGYQLGTNLHWSGASSCNYLDHESPLTISSLPLLSSVFHKYALQWDYDSMTIYFDDVPKRTISSSDAPSPNHFLELVFDVYVSQYASFPGSMSKDYR